jgi:hypothetical protein
MSDHARREHLVWVGSYTILIRSLGMEGTDDDKNELPILSDVIKSGRRKAVVYADIGKCIENSGTTIGEDVRMCEGHQHRTQCCVFGCVSYPSSRAGKRADSTSNSIAQDTLAPNI